MHPNIQKSAPKDQYLCDFMICYLLSLLIDVVAHSVTGVTNELTEKIEKLPIKEQKKIIKVIHTLLEE